MRIIILVIALLMSRVESYSQSLTNSELLDIIVIGMLENSTIQNLTFNFEGIEYVFFNNSSDLNDHEILKEGEINGINYKICQSDYLFFNSIEYYIEIYDIQLDKDNLIVKYKRRNSPSDSINEYFKGILKMRKLENDWIVKSNKLKK
jgi:hypothetical protein